MGKPCWELGSPTLAGIDAQPIRPTPQLLWGDYGRNFGELANMLLPGKGFTEMGMSSQDKA